MRADDVDKAVASVSADPDALYLAGAQIDLMLKDGVVEAERLGDITGLPLRGITRSDDTLTVGALTTMAALGGQPNHTWRIGIT